MRKSAPKKLTLQRETLHQLGAPLRQAVGGRPAPADTQTFPCNPWYSELYSACTCPPSWWGTCGPDDTSKLC